MFHLLKEHEFSFASFLVQQIVVPIVGLIAAAVAPDVFRMFTFGMPNPTLDNFWSTLVAFLLPFCGALIARRAAPRFSRDARLIWLAPMSLLIMGMISDSARFGFRSTVGNFLNPQTGEAAWVFLFLVIPTCACIGYSFGVSTKFSDLTARLGTSSANRPQS